MINSVHNTGNLKIVEDQRKHHRKPYFKSIVYATKNHLKNAKTKNISPSGVFIETADSLQRRTNNYAGSFH